jgi:hypothetical protein
MLFWDTTEGQFCGAWLYRSRSSDGLLGTSLMYWRETWERVPFRTIHEGEDTVWQLDLVSHGVEKAACSSLPKAGQPRMIAAIHGNNTTSRIQPGVREWRKASQWDKYCQEKMEIPCA